MEGAPAGSAFGSGTGDVAGSRTGPARIRPPAATGRHPASPPPGRPCSGRAGTDRTPGTSVGRPPRYAPRSRAAWGREAHAAGRTRLPDRSGIRAPRPRPGRPPPPRQRPARRSPVHVRPWSGRSPRPSPRRPGGAPAAWSRSWPHPPTPAPQSLTRAGRHHPCPEVSHVMRHESVPDLTSSCADPRRPIRADPPGLDADPTASRRRHHCLK